ncbi:MAG: alpha-methylacyl-CoA racemase [Granulosicoccus sp.]|jgi:alpha-methylacyl-CoA racemase
MQLLQMGASVTRVSPPTDRAIGIALNADTDVLNLGKTSLSIDLKEESGLAALHLLLSDADVLTEGFRPGVLERLGLDPIVLLEQFPQLVIGRLSGFGRYGEYALRAGHDINYLALSGALAAIGTHDEPIIPLNLIADFGGGAMYLLNGILARLVQRGIQGRGGLVDTSILGGTIGLTSMTHGLMAGGKWNLHRQQNLLDGGLPFYCVYKTQDDKFVAVGALEKPFFEALLLVVGLNSVFSSSQQYDSENWPAMSYAFSMAFAKRTRDDWAIEALASDCCLTPVLDFKESMNHPHNTANGWIVNEPFPHPGLVTHFTNTSS